jgi:hypothetical protein
MRTFMQSNRQRQRTQKNLEILSEWIYRVFVLGGTAGHLGVRRGGLHFFCPNSKERAWHAERLEQGCFLIRLLEFAREAPDVLTS